MNPVYVFSTKNSGYFADLIAAELGYERVNVERREFTDGEQYYRLDVADTRDLMGKEVLFIGSTHTDTDFLELVRIGGALATYGTTRRIFVIPFFGYASMERSVLPGEVVTAKENARLLSTIPSYGAGNTFLFLDLHASGLVHYFEGDDLRFELASLPLLINAVEELKLENFMFASPDLGRPAWVEKLAAHFETDIALISKSRRFEETKVEAVIGDVAGKTVVIYDDMVRSAGSLIKAAEAYKTRGATAIYAVISHLALSDPGVVAKIEASPITRIIGTNSHPMSQHQTVKDSSVFQVIDIAPVFAEAITRVIGSHR